MRIICDTNRNYYVNFETIPSIDDGSGTHSLDNVQHQPSLNVSGSLLLQQTKALILTHKEILAQTNLTIQPGGGVNISFSIGD